MIIIMIMIMIIIPFLNTVLRFHLFQAIILFEVTNNNNNNNNALETIIASSNYSTYQ